MKIKNLNIYWGFYEEGGIGGMIPGIIVEKENSFSFIPSIFYSFR